MLSLAKPSASSKRVAQICSRLLALTCSVHRSNNAVAAANRGAAVRQFLFYAQTRTQAYDQARKCAHLLIDVRPASHFEICKLSGARNIPLKDLRRRLASAPHKLILHPPVSTRHPPIAPVPRITAMPHGAIVRPSVRAPGVHRTDVATRIQDLIAFTLSYFKAVTVCICVRVRVLVSMPASSASLSRGTAPIATEGRRRRRQRRRQWARQAHRYSSFAVAGTTRR